MVVPEAHARTLLTVADEGWQLKAYAHHALTFLEHEQGILVDER